jgi:hypothetical protein
VKQYPVVIKDPIDIRSFIGKDASLQFVIPVHLNDDLISDFISVYWLSADSEKWGTHNTSPTPDILVAHLSQPNGTYEV